MAGTPPSDGARTAQIAGRPGRALYKYAAPPLTPEPLTRRNPRDHSSSAAAAASDSSLPLRSKYGSLFPYSIFISVVVTSPCYDLITGCKICNLLILVLCSIRFVVKWDSFAILSVVPVFRLAGMFLLGSWDVCYDEL